MRILAVDTSAHAGGLAVLENGELVRGSFARSDEEYSSRLFRELDLLLGEVRLKLSDFDLFAVAAGPGSFTALRIGMTAVKAWAEVYGKPICAVSGLKALACQSSGGAGLVAAYTDGRRGQVFGGLFANEGGQWTKVGDEVVMRPEEFLAEISARISVEVKHKNSTQPIRFVSATPEIVSGALRESKFHDASIEKVSEDLAPWIGKLAFDQAQRGETVSALALDANYIRRTDAENYWKDS